MRSRLSVLTFVEISTSLLTDGSFRRYASVVSNLPAVLSDRLSGSLAESLIEAHRFASSPNLRDIKRLYRSRLWKVTVVVRNPSPPLPGLAACVGKYSSKFAFGERLALLNGDIVVRVKIQDGWHGMQAGVQRQTRRPGGAETDSARPASGCPGRTLHFAANCMGAFAGILLLLVAPLRLNGAELKPKTARAFDQYIQKAELRMKEELKPGAPFLWIDTLSSADRAAAYARLRNGGIIVHPLAAGLDIPGGMIHDWVGIAFIPNVTLDETLAQIQDYNAYPRIYSPEVARSKTLEHVGNDFEVSLWLKKKSIVTVVLDVVENVQYFPLDSSRAYSCAHSTRIILVEDSGTSSDRKDRSALGQGYLWNLDGYGRFLQTPSGVYLQLEAIALSRNIPWGLEWLIRPFVTKVPRETLRFTLAHARASLERAAAPPLKLDSGMPPRARESASAMNFSKFRLPN